MFTHPFLRIGGGDPHVGLPINGGNPRTAKNEGPHRKLTGCKMLYAIHRQGLENHGKSMLSVVPLGNTEAGKVGRSVAWLALGRL